MTRDQLIDRAIDALCRFPEFKANMELRLMTREWMAQAWDRDAPYDIEDARCDWCHEPLPKLPFDVYGDAETLVCSQACAKALCSAAQDRAVDNRIERGR